MLLTSYSSNDAACVLSMLSDHIDFAPETTIPNNSVEDAAYFQDTYLNNEHSGYAYILREPTQKVKAFAVLNKWQEHFSSSCWYITALFVENNEDADQVALHMVSQIEKALLPGSRLYINVHPAAKEIVSFWSKNGYSLSIENSRYVNSDGVRLASYAKQVMNEI